MNKGFPNEGAKYIDGVEQLSISEEVARMTPEEKEQYDREMIEYSFWLAEKEVADTDHRNFNPSSYEDHKGR